MSDIPFSPVTFKSISRRLSRAIMELSLESQDEMAIELKGLRAKALAARGHLDKINVAYDKFNEAAPAHAADIAKMATDLGEMQSDLEFATNLLGNSAGESEKLAKEDAPKPGPFPVYPTIMKTGT
jgi:hypothetical protein